jgi:hypothetical protein
MAQAILSDIAGAQATIVSGALVSGGNNSAGNLNSPQRQVAHETVATAIVTLTAAQATALAAADILYLLRVNSGTLVSAESTWTSTGIGATTCTISVGDTDTVGGTVSADAVRYAAAFNANAAVTTPTFFINGTTTNAPAEIVDDNVWITATVATLTGTATSGRLIRFNIHLLDII